MISLTPARREQACYWLPALLTGGIAWAAFMVLGHTPIIRASGLALVIVGMALALRSMGVALTIIGGLALAFSPSFWIQTGGAESLNLPEVIGGLAAAGVAAGIALRFSRQRWFSLAAAVVIFSALFLTLIGTPRSLRLTTLLTAWLLYLLVDGLLVSNPRPDSPATGKLGAQHTYGLLIVLAVGVINDPLFVLLAPAAALGLFLSRKVMPVWYWLALLAVSAFGIYGVINTYYSTFWWNYPAGQALALTYQIPFLIGGVWREPTRWIGLMDLIVRQFTVFGLALGVLGLARLSRWYPPIGVVTMVAYATYAAFGLIYFGGDASVLLLPLLMIQLLWMTYAVYTFGQWLQKSLKPARVQWLAAAAFTLLPLLMVLRIVGLM